MIFQNETGSEKREDWTLCSIDDCVILRKEQFNPKKNVENLPYIGLEHIDQQHLKLVGIGKSNETISNKYKFYKGDILFGKLRPYFRKVFLPDFEGVCSTDIIVLIPKENIDVKFLFYLIASEEFISYSNISSTGTKMPRADWKFLKNLHFYLPPLKIQKLIGIILHLLTEKIEINFKMNLTLERIAQSIFNSYFLDFEFKQENNIVESDFSNLPTGWFFKKIEDLFDLVKGKKPKFIERKNAEVGEVYPYLIIELYENNKYNFWTKDKSRVIDELDIIFVADGARSGLLFRYERGFLGSTLLTLKQKDFESDLRNYVYLFFKSKEKKIIKMRTGTAIPHLDKHFLKNLHLALPPEEIIKKFNNKIKPIFEKIIFNRKQINDLIEMRETLVPHLISGELRLKNQEKLLDVMQN